MQKGITMYHPKRCCENVYYDKFEYHPKRALAERDQTFIDISIIINGGLLDQTLGYFVTKCSDGNPCANDIHH